MGSPSLLCSDSLAVRASLAAARGRRAAVGAAAGAIEDEQRLEDVDVSGGAMAAVVCGVMAAGVSIRGSATAVAAVSSPYSSPSTASTITRRFAARPTTVAAVVAVERCRHRRWIATLATATDPGRDSTAITTISKATIPTTMVTSTSWAAAVATARTSTQYDVPSPPLHRHLALVRHTTTPHAEKSAIPISRPVTATIPSQIRHIPVSWGYLETYCISLSTKKRFLMW